MKLVFKSVFGAEFQIGYQLLNQASWSLPRKWASKERSQVRNQGGCGRWPRKKRRLANGQLLVLGSRLPGAAAQRAWVRTPGGRPRVAPTCPFPARARPHPILGGSRPTCPRQPCRFRPVPEPGTRGDGCCARREWAGRRGPCAPAPAAGGSAGVGGGALGGGGRPGPGRSAGWTRRCF